MFRSDKMSTLQPNEGSTLPFYVAFSNSNPNKTTFGEKKFLTRLISIVSKPIKVVVVVVVVIVFVEQIVWSKNNKR